VYAYRPAGESCFEIGHVICGDDAHKLPSYFTLGVRELILEGRVGVLVDVAELPDATDVAMLADLCGLERPVTGFVTTETSEAQDTGDVRQDDGPRSAMVVEESSALQESEEATAPSDPSDLSEPKVTGEADESTTKNPGAATELVLVAPAVRAVSGAETTTARFRPPADATALHLHSQSTQSRSRVDDSNTPESRPSTSTGSDPWESVSWVFGETMRENAREHDRSDDASNGAASGAANTPQEAAPEDTCTPPTGDDSTGGEH